MRAPMFTSDVPGAQCVRPRSQVVLPSVASSGRRAHRCIAKRLGIAARGMQWARQGAPRIASFEREAVGRDALL